MGRSWLKIVTAFLAVVVIAGVSARASEMDGRIESAAAESYVFKTYLKDDNITIKSKDGVVTLQGTVAEESHRTLAQGTVENLPGVITVDNQLVYKGEHPVIHTNAWIEMKVKTALLFHRTVNAVKAEVDVRDGVVTLQGVASSQAQKALAGEYAGDIAGVREVRNLMTVAWNPGTANPSLVERVDDASITAQVKLALLTHRSTSAVLTTVSTNKGVVTVGGTAGSEAEKALVEKLAYDIPGVLKVLNTMTIADGSATDPNRQMETSAEECVDCGTRKDVEKALQQK